MAIKIKKKNTGCYWWKRGIYDIEPTVIKIGQTGAITIGNKETKNIFLGYQGEDHMRILNFDTRRLKWDYNNIFLEDVQHLYQYYTPLVIFYSPTLYDGKKMYYKRSANGTILVKDGDFIVTSEDGEDEQVGFPNPLIVTANENWCYIPNEITRNLTNYEIIYALVEKQENLNGIFDCSICDNQEVFVSEVFYGSVLESSKELFDICQKDFDEYCEQHDISWEGNNWRFGLQKPAIKLQIENGILSTELGETEIRLGRHGDSLITPIKITMPINNNLWVHNGDDICFEVVFTLEDLAYYVKPRITDKSDQKVIELLCWVPNEVTTQHLGSNIWTIAVHFYTKEKPIYEAYTTTITGEVEYTFLTKPVITQEEATPLYSVEEDVLVIAGEDWTNNSEEDLDNDFDDLDVWGEYDEEKETIDLGRHQV